MSEQTPPVLDEGRAWACLMTNLLVLPGLGSCAAALWLAGLLQAALALAGFVLTCVWAFSYLARLLEAHTLPESPGPYFALGLLGLALFAFAWVWSLLTGLALLRAARGGRAAARSGPA